MVIINIAPAEFIIAVLNSSALYKYNKLLLLYNYSGLKKMRSAVSSIFVSSMSLITYGVTVPLFKLLQLNCL